MRLLQIIQRYPPAWGGSEAVFRRLTEFHAQQGDTVEVWTTDALDLEAFWNAAARSIASAEPEGHPAITIRRFKPRWRFRGRRYLLKPLSWLPWPLLSWLTLPCNPICPAMWRAAGRAQQRFDAVHASAFPYTFPIACGLRLARRQQVPFFLTPFLHLGDPTDPNDRTRRQYTSPHLRTLLRSADLVFAQTPTEHRLLLECGVAPERAILQGLGVDPTECTGGDRQAFRQRHRIPQDAPVIGHLANQSVEKGSVDLLAAAEQLWQQGESFYLVLAGPEMPNFRVVWQGFARKDRVVRLHPLAETEKRDFFAALDLFALPSRSDSFGLVLLEAWANGLPNVVYRAGGPADLVRHDRDGKVVACGDRNALAEALRQLLHQPEVARQMGAAGRARLEREFRWEDKLALVRHLVLDRLRRRST